MGNRLSKIYTKTGDDGSTSSASGKRIKKTDLSIKALGQIDELNSLIGIVLSDKKCNSLIAGNLLKIQNILFDCGGIISIADSKLKFDEKRIDWLEKLIDKYNNELGPLKEFILPGGSGLASKIHFLRSKTRTVEIYLVELNETQPLFSMIQTFMNRLSDFFFVLARLANKIDNEKEIFWKKDFTHK
jgi:cob(I)alamin adenosyltransferase